VARAAALAAAALLAAACATGQQSQPVEDNGLSPTDGAVDSGGTRTDGPDPLHDGPGPTPDGPDPCAGKDCNDNLPCTKDSCSGGICANSVQAGTCLIAGACHNGGDKKAGVQCQACRPATTQSDWTDDVSLCTDDGLGCTVTSCAQGQCGHTVQPGKCLVSGVCHAEGTKDSQNPCRSCQSSLSTSAWSPLSSGACAGGTCLAGACCTGCVSAATCEPGTAVAACGKAGGACTPCQSGNSCNAGVCGPSAPVTLNVGSYGSTYSAAAHTRGYWFTAPINFTIVGLRVPTDVGTAVQNVEVLRINAALPTTSYTSLVYKKGVTGSAFIPVNVPITKGEVIGVLGARGTTTMYNSYAGVYTYATTIGGQSVTLQRLMLQSNLYTAKASGELTTNAHYYARVELQYLPY
jgi:hypothetical protein